MRAVAFHLEFRCSHSIEREYGELSTARLKRALVSGSKFHTLIDIRNSYKYTTRSENFKSSRSDFVKQISSTWSRAEHECEP